MKGKKLITTICIVCVLATLLCIPAFATVTESDGDGFALYNGVKLPDIDSVWTDKDTFPYSFLLSRVGTTRTVLWLTSEPVVFNSSDKFRIETLGREYWLEAGSSSWEYKTQVETGSSLSGSSYQLLWSNHDILKYDNTIYFSASDPIPLDGYNVIEWDGDTTGLTSFAEAYYKVSNDVPVYTQFVGGYFVANPLNGSRDVYSVTYEDITVVPNDGYYVVLEPVVVAQDTTTLPATGIYAVSSDGGYVFLIAYRTTETPPDEGGGDDDDPQPPVGG